MQQQHCYSIAQWHNWDARHIDASTHRIMMITGNAKASFYGIDTSQAHLHLFHFFCIHDSWINDLDASQGLRLEDPETIGFPKTGQFLDGHPFQEMTMSVHLSAMARQTNGNSQVREASSGCDTEQPGGWAIHFLQGAGQKGGVKGPPWEKPWQGQLQLRSGFETQPEQGQCAVRKGSCGVQRISSVARLFVMANCFTWCWFSLQSVNSK